MFYYFKQYNDFYGHSKGDEALKSVANYLEFSLQRVDDYCFRLGGEEFGIILNSKTCLEAKTFAEKLVKGLENLQIEHKENKVSKYLTISAGLSCTQSSKVSDIKFIYEKADKLLYEAKENGRNRVSSELF